MRRKKKGYILCIDSISVFVHDMYGIGEEVFLSLPCVLNSTGVSSVVNMTLTDPEVTQLRKSADTLWSIQKDLKNLWTHSHKQHTAHRRPVNMHTLLL